MSDSDWVVVCDFSELVLLMVVRRVLGGLGAGWSALYMTETYRGGRLMSGGSVHEKESWDLGPMDCGSSSVTLLLAEVELGFPEKPDVRRG